MRTCTTHEKGDALPAVKIARRPALRIGTRGSPLALRQTDEVKERLIAAHPELAEPGAVEVVAIRTTGDRITDRPLADLGGKGLFTKEIEDALLGGRIDLAVHSMKDVQTWLPAGLAIACMPPRADPRDVLITRDGVALDELPRGARVGTASLRRRAQIKARRPDLSVGSLRGNVGTRLDKIARGEVDATLLAAAGLRRLGLAPAGAIVLEPEEMLPAAGQGAIGVEVRADDERARALLAPLSHRPTEQCVHAERAALAALDGSCRTPIAALATAAGEAIALRVLLAAPDGDVLLAAERRGAAADGAALGRDAGEELRRRAGPRFLAWGG